MKPSRIETVLKKTITGTWPVFLWGPPGVGKSSIVKKVAADAKLELIDLRASLLDPTDLRGLPAVTEGKAVWYPPSFLPSKEGSSGILFFDELNAAPPLVQASLYQLTLDRRVGEYRLPEGWRILAAGNRAQDASVVFRMPAALSNRFIHLDFEADIGDWRIWAQTNDIHPLVVGFLSLKPALLFNMGKNDRAFPTPRSWEMLSTALQQFETADALADLIQGIVGEGAGIEFLAYARKALSEEKMKAILADPEAEPLPEDLGGIYTLISYLAAWGKEVKVRRAAGILLGRLNPEAAVLLIRDLLRIEPRFMLDPGCAAFIAAHKDFLK